MAKQITVFLVLAAALLFGYFLMKEKPPLEPVKKQFPASMRRTAAKLRAENDDDPDTYQHIIKRAHALLNSLDIPLTFEEIQRLEHKKVVASSENDRLTKILEEINSAKVDLENFVNNAKEYNFNDKQMLEEFQLTPQQYDKCYQTLTEISTILIGIRKNREEFDYQKEFNLAMVGAPKINLRQDNRQQQLNVSNYDMRKQQLNIMDARKQQQINYRQQNVQIENRMDVDMVPEMIQGQRQHSDHYIEGAQLALEQPNASELQAIGPPEAQLALESNRPPRAIMGPPGELVPYNGDNAFQQGGGQNIVPSLPASGFNQNPDIHGTASIPRNNANIPSGRQSPSWDINSPTGSDAEMTPMEPRDNN